MVRELRAGRTSQMLGAAGVEPWDRRRAGGCGRTLGPLACRGL